MIYAYDLLRSLGLYGIYLGAFGVNKVGTVASVTLLKDACQLWWAFIPGRAREVLQDSAMPELQKGAYPLLRNPC